MSMRGAVAALCLTFAGVIGVPAHAAPATLRQRVADIVSAAQFDGTIVIADRGAILWQTMPADCAPAPKGEIVLCHPRNPAYLRWPWASVSKQALAVLTMMEVDAGRIGLDVPASRYLPALGKGAPSPTVRQLLQHRAGLRNPNDSTPDAAGEPSFYSTGPTGLNWCLAKRAAPGGDWKYNNCDSIVIGAILTRVTGKSLPALFAARIATPLRFEGTGYVGQPATRLPEFARGITAAERNTLTRYGAAGGLAGTALDLLAFDRALLAGGLISAAAREELWRGDPQLGYMALAQWSFDARLKGCAKPVHLIERRGEIGRFEARNILIPESGLSIIVFTAKSGIDFGEIWQGKGFSHDLLAAAACQAGAVR